MLERELARSKLTHDEDQDHIERCQAEIDFLKEKNVQMNSDMRRLFEDKSRMATDLNASEARNNRNKGSDAEELKRLRGDYEMIRKENEMLRELNQNLEDKLNPKPANTGSALSATAKAFKPSERFSPSMSMAKAKKEDTAKLGKVAEEDFVTPTRAKSAFPSRVIPKVSLATQNATKNAFAALADNQEVVTPHSHPDKPAASQPAPLALSSSQSKRPDNKGVSMDSGPRQDQNTSVSKSGPSRPTDPPRLTQAAKTKELSKPPASSPAPAVAKTPSPPKQTAAAGNGKQAQRPSASTPAEKTPRTTADVVANPPPKEPFTSVERFLLEGRPEKLDQVAKSKRAARIASLRLLVARGSVEPTTPQRKPHPMVGSSRNSQSPAPSEYVDQLMSEAFGHEYPKKSQSPAAGKSLDEVFTDNFGDTSGKRWCDIDDDEGENSVPDPGYLPPAVEVDTDKSPLRDEPDLLDKSKRECILEPAHSAPAAETAPSETRPGPHNLSSGVQGSESSRTPQQSQLLPSVGSTASHESSTLERLNQAIELVRKTEAERKARIDFENSPPLCSAPAVEAAQALPERVLRTSAETELLRLKDRRSLKRLGPL